jgi:hypothetical protein
MGSEIRKRFEASEARDKRLDEKFEKRHQAAMKRSEEADKRFQTKMGKLIATGMQEVKLLAKERREDRAETRALKAEMRAYIKAQGNGHRGPNGRGRH